MSDVQFGITRICERKYFKRNDQKRSLLCQQPGFPVVFIIRIIMQDHAWWQTRFIKGKMILLFIILFVVIPLFADSYWLSVCNQIGYTVLGALGVQLLIGFCGQVTLGHAAFIAVGAYTSTLLILEFPWPKFMMDFGIAYPISILIAAFAAGIWSVLVRTSLARVKGFYLILTTMAAQFITVDFIITQDM